MRATHLSALTAMLLAGLSAPVSAATSAANEVRIADNEVAHQTEQARKAVRQGDPATIAVARAKLQAAQAIAWGKRHPAKAPVERVAAN